MWLYFSNSLGDVPFKFKTTKTMENIMKEMLVSGVQARVGEETFVKRLAYLLDENMLAILCTGVPEEILTYNEDKIKLTLELLGYDKATEIKNVELTNDPCNPVIVTYKATVTRYFSSKEDAAKAEETGNRYAGSRVADGSHSVVCDINYFRKAGISRSDAEKCCTFKRI